MAPNDVGEKSIDPYAVLDWHWGTVMGTLCRTFNTGARDPIEGPLFTDEVSLARRANLIASLVRWTKKSHKRTTKRIRATLERGIHRRYGLMATITSRVIMRDLLKDLLGKRARRTIPRIEIPMAPSGTFERSVEDLLTVIGLTVERFTYMVADQYPTTVQFEQSTGTVFIHPDDLVRYNYLHDHYSLWRGRLKTL